jgi:hypothetical protein
VVYKPVPRSEILASLAHVYDLHRRVKPSSERERLVYERREAAVRDLMSNLPRTNEHPTLKALLEVADVCWLTLEGVHRLFGYSLGGIRDYDLRLNGSRTHIKSSHQGLRPGEVHRSLGICQRCEREREEGWRQNAQNSHPSWGWKEGTQPPAGRSGLSKDLRNIVINHQHLRRLKAVEICRDHRGIRLPRPIRSIYRVIVRSYRPALYHRESANFFIERQLNSAFFY